MKFYIQNIIYLIFLNNHLSKATQNLNLGAINNIEFFRNLHDGRHNSYNGNPKLRNIITIARHNDKQPKFENIQQLVNISKPNKMFSILEQLKKDRWQLEANTQPLHAFHIPHIWHVHVGHEHEPQPELEQPPAVPSETFNNIKSTSSAKKKKRKRKKKKKKRKKKPKQKRKKIKPQEHEHHIVGQPAQIIYTTALTQKPYHHHYTISTPIPHTIKTTTRPVEPTKKIKYVLYKSSALVKKKKEYLNHLSHVIYPFIKFIVFFTVINPFTLGVFLFTLFSPVVFGFIGFIALSILIKPSLQFLFDFKHRVSAINRKKQRERRKQQLLSNNRRPITIHKHYYKYQPLHSHRQSKKRRYNPLLPHVKHKLKYYL